MAEVFCASINGAQWLPQMCRHGSESASPAAIAGNFEPPQRKSTLPAMPALGPAQMILGKSKRWHGGQCTLALRRLKIAGNGSRACAFAPVAAHLREPLGPVNGRAEYLSHRRRPPGQALQGCG